MKSAPDRVGTRIKSALRIGHTVGISSRRGASHFSLYSALLVFRSLGIPLSWYSGPHELLLTGMTTIQHEAPGRGLLAVVPTATHSATGAADPEPVPGWRPYRERGAGLARVHGASPAGLTELTAPTGVVDAGFGWHPAVVAARPEDHDLQGPWQAWRPLSGSYLGDADYDLALAAAGILRQDPAPLYGVTGLLSGYAAGGGPGRLQPRLVDHLLATGVRPGPSGEGAVLSGRAGNVRECRRSRSG